MAKRVKMLSPFKALRGNVSGSQDLEYPLNGQGAYEAPAGKHYAQNYDPRFIVCERASDGRVYFQVKQRSATNITAKSKKAMAVLGGAGAIMGAILKDKTSALYAALMNAFEETHPVIDGKPATFRQYVTRYIIAALRAKFPMISVIWNNAGALAMITINNPFVSGGAGTYDVEISGEVLVKFWGELASKPISFEIEGVGKGVAHMEDTFLTLIAANYNTLGLTSNDAGAVKLSGEYGEYLLDGTSYVDESDPVVNGTVFSLTNVAPE